MFSSTRFAILHLSALHHNSIFLKDGLGLLDDHNHPSLKPMPLRDV